jgi:hypothetical protein
MLEELAAEAAEYDAPSDTLRVTSAAGFPAGRTKPKAGSAQLLLDKKGMLVGVDLPDNDGSGRWVVMLGPHEAVKSTTDGSVQVQLSGDGARLVVFVSNAKKAARGAERNPYL